MITSINIQEERFTEVMLDAAQAERIYLLGSTTLQRRTQSIFYMEQPSCRVTAHYYLLVLVEETTTALGCIQDRIENRLQGWIPATVLVYTTDRFAHWLSTGNQFAVWVAEAGTLLYDEGNVVFPPAAERKDTEAEDQLALANAKQKAESFLAGAELYSIRKEYHLAAFMLHQAAEQALKAMLVFNTGLQVRTHNLDKLARYCSMFCDQLQDIFPMNNSDSGKLFKKLKDAYLQGRYEKEFSVSEEEVEGMRRKVERVRKLMG